MKKSSHHYYLIPAMFLLGCYLGTTTTSAQCYSRDAGNSLNPTVGQSIDFPVKQELERFFSLESIIYFQEEVDAFCLDKTQSQADVHISLGNTFLNYLNANGDVVDPYLAKLFSASVYEQFEQRIEPTEYDYITDHIAGYYVCYQYIALNWDSVNESVSSLVAASDFLNEVLNKYARVRMDYLPHQTGASLNERKIKKSFLNGAYYAMPRNYRQHIRDTTDYKNDYAGLMNTIIDDRQYAAQQPNDTLPIVFEIKYNTL
ncbi:hypothetical protein [Gilvibacter sp.]|uniref:hypothetical protein n=1 Tax=Gilvibacter sp. TaxID=2729997 RepID=UPI003F4A14B0